MIVGSNPRLKFDRAVLPIPVGAEQTMGMPAIQRRWTPADVRELMDETRPWPRYELVGGELLVTPAPGIQHQLVVTELLRTLADYLEREPVGVACVSPADLELRSGSITQPDVFVMPATPEPPAVASDGWENVKSLVLAVEVLSPGSGRSDRVIKRDYYLDAGVPEYWIVDVVARVIERWTPSQQRPDLVRDRLEWRPPRATQRLVIDVPRFFERLSDLKRLSGL